MVAACASPNGEQAGEGAAKGAIAGALAGLMVVGIFGGSEGTAAAAGAIAGAATGAAVGASRPPRPAEPVISSVPGNPPTVQREQEKRLRAELGPSAYAGLEALAQCRHDEALLWAKNAAYTDVPEHALAGVWLAAVTYGDAGRIEEARAVLPEIVEKDPKVDSEQVAERLVDQWVVRLQDLRVAYGEPAACSS